MTKNCKSCFENIHFNATVCKECGRHQNLIIQNLQHVGIAVSIVMLLLAYQQYKDASKDRVATTEALKNTEIVESRVRVFKRDIIEGNIRSYKILLNIYKFRMDNSEHPESFISARDNISKKLKELRKELKKAENELDVSIKNQ
jgi:hypothetical protein